MFGKVGKVPVRPLQPCHVDKKLVTCDVSLNTNLVTSVSPLQSSHVNAKLVTCDVSLNKKPFTGSARSKSVSPLQPFHVD